VSGRSEAQVRGGQPVQSEAAEERAARLSREHALLEEGFEDSRAGRAIEGDEALRWLKDWCRGGPPEGSNSGPAL
jgi:predicted transcriptional regulator